ncbi:MAG: hypothetical protein DWQ01_11980 [Planctomycetota bacterium]|nr:MAG: hypothetical protein DWQ01_11980 [Planctomycetota bacterium]
MRLAPIPPVMKAFLFCLPLALAPSLPAQDSFETQPSQLVAGASGDLVLRFDGTLYDGSALEYVFYGTNYPEAGWTKPQTSWPGLPGYVEAISDDITVEVIDQGSSQTLVRVMVHDWRPWWSSTEIVVRNTRAGSTALIRSLEAYQYDNYGSGGGADESAVFPVVAAAPSQVHLSIPSMVDPGNSVILRAASIDSHFNFSPYDGRVRLQLLDLQSGQILQQNLNLDLQQGFGSVDLGSLSNGAYYLQTRPQESLSGESNPLLIVNLSTPFLPIQWGDPQVHGQYSRDALPLAWTELGTYARDVAFLNWIVATDHGSHMVDSPGSFDQMRQAVLALQTSEFTPFPGFEWTSEGPLQNLSRPAHQHSWGHREVIFRDPSEALVLSAKDPAFRDFPDFLNELETWAPSGFLAVPHHLGGAFFRQFYNGGPWWGPIEGVDQAKLEAYSAVVEIYSDLGAAESRYDQDNWRPSKIEHEDFILQNGEPTRRFRDACSAGFAYGVVGASDGHTGRIGMPVQGRQYKMGITAVYADSGHDPIFDALAARRSYATSGARIAVLASLAGLRPGQVIPAQGGPMQLHFAIAGTAPLQQVVLVKDGVDQSSWQPSGGTERHLEVQVNLPRDSGVYYLRVEQQATALAPDGDRAWTSPWRVP